MTNQFDYNVVKPDQSLIEIRKGYKDQIGYFIWNDEYHIYEYKGMMPVDERSLIEILESLKKLNKKSILPKWLQWGRSKK